MASGNLAAGFAAGTGPVVRAEDCCHASPKLPAVDACDARREIRFADRGAQRVATMAVQSGAQSSRGKDRPFLPGETRGTGGTTPGRMTSLCPGRQPGGLNEPGRRFLVDLSRGLLEEGGRGVILAFC